MTRSLIGIAAALWLAGTAHAQVGGNLVKYPPVDVRIDITTAPDGKPVLAPSEIRLITGEYYRLTLSSDGKGKDERGEPLARRVELTEFLSNNAVAVIYTPVAIELAHRLGYDPRPFVVAVMFSATLAFATPVGYQTNMMVYGPGGYRFSDFTKVGLPLNIIVMLVSCALIPLIWPL